MLEQEMLRLLPWRWTLPGAVAGLASAAWIRRVVSGTGADLGFVLWTRGPSWAGLGPERLDVCETDDAALLMALEHGWFASGRWAILDAEHAQVGAVIGAHLLDDHGFRFATLWHEAHGVQRIQASAGKAYACVEVAADGGDLLHFDPRLEANPFLRMVLLGAVLAKKTRFSPRRDR